MFKILKMIAKGGGGSGLKLLKEFIFMFMV